jgi:N-hydroxyarylamine O-acetyltransferase
MSEVDVYGYLERLRLPDPGPPSVDGLRLLHRAQVERVPYENLDIQLGRPPGIEPASSFRRVLAGRGGYCYHLNGAFALLLSALGYAVRWHRGGVQGRDEPHPVGAVGNHLALTVHGLPTADNPDGMWFVDVGLGDGLYEPLPLRAGQHRDGPFRFALAPSSKEFLGWRFEHDPAIGSFTGLDFRADVAVLADFRAKHEWLSTAPESAFVRVATVQRRDATGADVLRGRVLTRVPDGRPVELTTAADWHAALADVFGIVLPQDDRAALWHRVSAAHDAWLARS